MADLEKKSRRWAGDDDPTRDVKTVKSKSKHGFHRWSEDEIAQFESVHPIGSKPRLAIYRSHPASRMIPIQPTSPGFFGLRF